MTRTRLGLSLLVITGVIAAMVTVLTTAVFSDQVTSTGNTLTAGTLYMSVDGECADRTAGGGGDGGGTGCQMTSSPLTTSGMVPGAEATHQFIVVNLGTLPGTLSVTVDPATATCFTVGTPVIGNPALDATGGANDETTVDVTITLNETADNTCQGATETFDVVFNLDQVVTP